MNTISISEIQRNLHKLNDFDIVEVVDKKYHDFVEELFQAKENKNADKLKALEAMGSYSLGGSDIEDIKASMYDD